MKSFIFRFFEGWGADLAAGDGVAWGLVVLVILLAVLAGLGVADLIFGWRRSRTQKREQAARERARREFLAGQRSRLRDGLADFRLPEPPVPAAWQRLN